MRRSFRRRLKTSLRREAAGSIRESGEVEIEKAVTTEKMFLSKRCKREPKLKTRRRKKGKLRRAFL